MSVDNLLSRKVMEDSSELLPFVELLSVDGINASLPHLALQLHLLLVMEDSSELLPCVELLSVDGINASLPHVALQFHLFLLQQTHDKIKFFRSGHTRNFVIFLPDDSIAYILDQIAVLSSDSV